MFKNTKMTTLVMVVLAPWRLHSSPRLGYLQFKRAAQGRRLGHDSLPQNVVPLAAVGEFSRYFYRAWSNLIEATLIRRSGCAQPASCQGRGTRIRQTEEKLEALDKSLKIEAFARL
jgi:hypothetical protein